ncbi:YlaH-like family protein [Texcoconibacillus texcoconensis]|uniref:YlaH-like protein n=1 Tax=Texcoconibacillus texcoconensis TaxID=1095777 RepID=A0A840QLH4_9BACI|nr:YlaH-like family protein [Texcoconibacillus texcoconensis]MBB5172224.1 hypothetical protein [Texcoconibacillus texcoconensis]
MDEENLPEEIPEPDFTYFAELFGAQDPEQFVFAFAMLYLIVNFLTIVVYNLGFARKLPILKNVIIYVVLLFGNIFITFLALTLPVIESLFIAAVVLVVYRLQLRRHKSEKHDVQG